MPFSYNAVWDDTVRMFRAHAPLITAIAGVFIFLPNLLLGYFGVDPQPQGRDLQALYQAYESFWRENWYWMFLDLIASCTGTLAILILVFDRQRPTVAVAITGAATLLPYYLAASLLSSFLLLVGFFALFVPFLYLLGRLAPLAPVMVVEGRRNPIDALKRCFEVTKGYGWTILLLLTIVAVSASLLIIVLRAVAGLLLILILGEDLAAFLVLILTTGMQALLSIVLVLLAASIYRQVTART